MIIKKARKKLRKVKDNQYFHRLPLYLTLFYSVFSILWIVLFHEVATEIFSNYKTLYELHTYESILFFIVTSIFLYMLLSRIIKDTEKNKKIENLKERLNESESVFSTFFYKNNAMMMLLESDTGKIRDINNATCSFLGYSKEELKNMNISDIDTLEPKLFKKHIECAKDKNSNSFNSICKLANGVHKNIEIYNTIIKANNEELILGIFHDITDRVNSQKKLVNSERKYRRLVEMLPDAVIGWSEEGEIVFTNQNAKSLLGYDSDQELKTKTIYDTFHKDYLKKVEERLETLKRKKQVTLPTVEMKGIKKNGEIIDVEVKSTYYDIEDNLMIITIIRDITEKKLKEHELKKLYQAIEQSSSMVIITDKEGKIEYVNSNFNEISGYSIDEVIGKSPDVLDAKKQPKEVREKMWDTINSGHRWRGEFLNKRKNGQLYWVDASISPVINEYNNVTNYVAVQTDITATKNILEELELANSQLNCMLGRLRTTQAQLVQQEKLAGIGQLAAGVAHEINNPMGYIISNFNTLKKYFANYRKVLIEYQQVKDKFSGSQGNNVYQLINEIDELLKNNNIEFIDKDLELLFNETNHGLDRVKEIVTGLRIFSRIDGDGDFEEYDLNEGISNTLIIARNEIKYHAEVLEELNEIPFIQAKGGEINQVILNLVINSAYATKVKKSQDDNIIKITTFNDEEYVYCEIEDNGIGIPKENLDSIFNPFFTTKPVGDGTGLGLSIAYEIIVNKHKGTIEVESEVGLGTKFRIKLPIHQSNRSSF